MKRVIICQCHLFEMKLKCPKWNKTVLNKTKAFVSAHIINPRYTPISDFTMERSMLNSDTKQA